MLHWKNWAMVLCVGGAASMAAFGGFLGGLGGLLRALGIYW
jgi:hypothetical protein